MAITLDARSLTLPDRFWDAIYILESNSSFFAQSEMNVKSIVFCIKTI